MTSNISRIYTTFIKFMLNLTISFLRLIPLRWRQHTGAFLGTIFYYIPTRERKVALLQVKACLPNLDSNEIVRKMYSNLGVNILETFSIDKLLKSSTIQAISSNLNIPECFSNSDRPIVILSAHTGNWDLLAAYAGSVGLKLCTIGRSARSESLQSALEKIRTSVNVETIWREDPSAGKKIIRSLNQKKIVAALIDQDTKVTSCLVNFFSKPCKTPSTLVDIAIKLSADIYYAFIFRESTNSFKIFVEKASNDLQTSDILQEYSDLLEKLIKQNPSQWVWLHKRWRSPSLEKCLSSKEYIECLQSQLN